MLSTALIFFVLALVAFILGATGVAGISMEIGRVLLTVFLLISIVSVLAGLVLGGNKT